MSLCCRHGDQLDYAFSAERLMGGTDWPIKPELLSYERRVALTATVCSFLSHRERQELLAGTVTRVWPFPAE